METKTIAEQFPWAEAGASAFIYEQGSWGYRNLTATKIQSVTKARINLEGGRVFYIPKHATKLVERGRDYYRSPSLIPTDDPAVEETRLLLEKQKIDNAARAAAEQFNKSRTVDNAHKAVAALLDFIKANEEEGK